MSFLLCEHDVCVFVAVGCSDVIPPEDAWLKRIDDKILIGCYSSRQTWQLTCNGGKWVGVLGNCSDGELPVLVLSLCIMQICKESRHEGKCHVKLCAKFTRFSEPAL